ncbi:prepilin-type N-terminal cleavage/methylation domain-containing protein [Deefgea salmonis]|uniref:Prepilin-type N-terminal cleavage/methylation domain-containing protein n=1 Tax=Deefgea salmonis TaxID=2875502 RepID=A0ABS8BJN3_9NEIS|nr:prepilin-type N-terminal cleavage/methylation domain-containing protein [Deefgea salmonis]MCB5195933.1 prepilin-type N-terminal cleavage/methylation domain-containing protein [Deefgea salmonis]
MLNHKQLGMSLIELMVSMALGLLLLGAASSMALSSLFANKDGLRNMALEQEIQPMMSLISRELRRSGYSQLAEDDTSMPNKYFRKINMPGAIKTTVAGKNIYTGSCIIFRYDSNKNNILSNDEVSGFMLSNGQLLILNSPSSLNIDTCDASDPKWQAMNNKDRINITTFSMAANTETISTIDLINKIDITLTGASTDGSFSSTLKDSIQLRNLPRVY